jgi:long-chain fatty acid transport protein
VAAGIDIAYVSLKQRRQINLSRVGEDSGFGPIPGNPEGSVELEGEATAVGSNLGILISPTDRWQFGISLRSRLHAEEENGRADFTIPVPAFQPFFPDGWVRTEVDLPPVLRAGILARPLPQWNIEFDAVWTGWSTIDQLVVEFEQGLPVARDTTEFLWDDSFTYNLGTEYRWSDFAFRGGYTLDLSPIPDSTISPILPDGTRQWFSLGIGYGALPWKLDFAYTIILINRLKENDFGGQYSSAGSPPVIPAIDARANGEYSTNTHLVGFSVSHYF